MMNNDLAIPDITVTDVLKANPQAVSFFFHHQTACVGCYLAKFCTLEDVINTYKINRQPFLEELAKIMDLKI